MNDPVLQSSDFDTVSELASHLSNLRRKLRDTSIILRGHVQHIVNKLGLVGDFTFGQMVENLNSANETLINEAIKRVSESLNAYKEAVEVDILGTMDDEAIKDLKAQQSDIEEFQQRLVDIQF